MLKSEIDETNPFFKKNTNKKKKKMKLTKHEKSLIMA